MPNKTNKQIRKMEGASSKYTRKINKRKKD